MMPSNSLPGVDAPFEPGDVFTSDHANLLFQGLKKGDATALAASEALSTAKAAAAVAETASQAASNAHINAGEALQKVTEATAAATTASQAAVAAEASAQAAVNAVKPVAERVSALERDSVTVHESIGANSKKIDANKTATDQSLQALQEQINGIANSGKLRIKTASLNGSVAATTTRVPWYPPADASEIKNIRLQLATPSPTDTVVTVSVAGNVGVDYTLKAGASMTLISDVNIDITNSPAITIKLKTTGGEDFTLSFEYH